MCSFMIMLKGELGYMINTLESNCMGVTRNNSSTHNTSDNIKTFGYFTRVGLQVCYLNVELLAKRVGWFRRNSALNLLLPINFCFMKVLTWVYLWLAGGYSKWKIPNKEYIVSPKDTNRKIELDITWDSYVSSLPLSIVV